VLLHAHIIAEHNADHHTDAERDANAYPHLDAHRHCCDGDRCCAGSDRSAGLIGIPFYFAFAVTR
jgi:hypothetical protein